MSVVIIEGTVTPSTLLGRGHRARVERTAYINKLVRNGFIRIIAEEPDVEPELEPVVVVKSKRKSADPVGEALDPVADADAP